nr:MAG TPA: hypothetical protein [Caudoviricetes sp.]
MSAPTARRNPSSWGALLLSERCPRTHPRTNCGCWKKGRKSA